MCLPEKMDCSELTTSDWSRANVRW